MKRKGSFFKVFFYTLIASILIFGGSRSFGYIGAKTFEKIDLEIESSMQRTPNCGYIIATKLNLKVYGEINDGTPFEGLGTIWIINK